MNRVRYKLGKDNTEKGTKADLGSHVLGFLTEVTTMQRGTGTALPCVL